MAVQFQDYYQILGVSKKATQAEIQKAYRNLARKYHPDVNKEKDAEEKFKKASEAYEVLKNPQTRQKYDAVGSNYKAGDPFTPPSGWRNKPWEDLHVDINDLGQQEGTGFSDFFNTIFGQFFHTSEVPKQTRSRTSPKRENQEIEIAISLQEAFKGTEKTIALQKASLGFLEQSAPQAETYRVRIPKGVTEGTRIQVKGDATHGDIYLKIKLVPHPLFQVHAHDLLYTLPITPWEAALGAQLEVPTLDGKVRVKIPKGSQSGSQLRLRGKGLPKRNGSYGDLLLKLEIHVPPKLTSQEEELFKQLAAVSPFNPRLKGTS